MSRDREGAARIPQVDVPMRSKLVKQFHFEAAHWLPTFPPGHKCRRMHGHSFRLEVIVEGQVAEEKGYLIDFGEITAAVDPVIEVLDHHVLNEIDGLANPTAEMLARWVYDRVKPKLALLTAVRVYETCTSAAEYAGR
jgi:6-pyruvoyltetrahydropterin/6-carboxytetrahydropterin synthase